MSKENKLPIILDANKLETQVFIVQVMSSVSWGYVWKNGWKYGRLKTASGKVYRIEQKLFERIKSIKEKNKIYF